MYKIDLCVIQRFLIRNIILFFLAFLASKTLFQKLNFISPKSEVVWIVHIKNATNT